MPTNMADQVGELDLFLAVAKDWDVFLPKPITTKHQSVFWLVSQSRRMSAICVGSCRWISLAAACADPVYRTACYRPIICWRLALWTCVLYLIQTRDTNTLRAQYLENYLSYETSNLVCSFLSGMPSARTNNFLWKWAWPRSRDPQFLVYDRAYLQNYLS